MSITRYADHSELSYQAQQIWLVLIGKAYNRQLTTYAEVAKILGFDGAGVLSRQLGHVMHYCEQNRLPPLTVLVVNSETGKPGIGFTAAEDADAARAKVFNFHWYSLIPPSPSAFDEAWHVASNTP